MAKLYFRYGAMSSAKTSNMLQSIFNYESNGKHILLMKPSVDTKGEAKAVSRIGLEREVDYLITPTTGEQAILDMLAESHAPISCIFIDEAQFLTRHQVDVFFGIAVQRNIPVIAYGLRADFQSNGFPGSVRLLELSHSLEELKTICSICEKKATMNARKINGKFVAEGEQIAIDGSASGESTIEYTSLCGECYLKYVRNFTTVGKK